MLKPVKASLIGVAFLCCYTAAHSQTIDEVRITGLRKTRVSFVNRFISTKTGITVDSTQIESDRQRLINLALFSRVNWDIHRNDSLTVLVFTVEEFINTLPILAVGKTDDTFWCRAGIQSLNFTGRGDKLIAYYQYYESPLYSIELPYG